MHAIFLIPFFLTDFNEQVGRFPPFSQAITALAFHPCSSLFAGYNILAVGFENGEIQLWTLKRDALEPSHTFAIPLHECHADSVFRLVWKPQEAQIQPDGSVGLCLSSASADHSVRMYSVHWSDPRNLME